MTETSPTQWCFEASDGYQLVCHHWKPSAGTETKARILISISLSDLINELRTFKLSHIGALGKPSRVFNHWIISWFPISKTTITKETFNHVFDAVVVEASLGEF